MTDNQFNQLLDLVTKSVNGIQRLEKDISVLKEDVSVLKQDMSEVKTDIAELKSDVSELKAGQNRIEKQTRLNNAVVNEIAGEQFRIKSQITELEKVSV